MAPPAVRHAATGVQPVFVTGVPGNDDNCPLTKEPPCAIIINVGGLGFPAAGPWATSWPQSPVVRAVSRVDRQ